MTPCEPIDFVAVIEGIDPDGRMAQHLETCERCRKELQAYEQLVHGLVAGRRECSVACSHKDNTIGAALGESEADQAHLLQCTPCRELHGNTVSAAGDVDRQDISAGGLPPSIAEKVAQQKKKWMRGRLRNVLDFQGIKDKKAQDERIEEMLSEADDALPLAAFPDDLTGNEKGPEKTEEEDNNKE